jgi:RNase H-like domain found in reverse transcriptase
LKEKLCKAPVLAWPDFAKPFIVYTDGSASGVGGALAQEQEGKVHSVAYASRRLSEPERRLLFPLEFEALAVIYSLDAFRWAVFGHRVTVITDHSALKWLFTLKVPSSK